MRRALEFSGWVLQKKCRPVLSLVGSLLPEDPEMWPELRLEYKAWWKTEATIHLFTLEPGLSLLIPVNFTSQMIDVGINGRHQMQSSPVHRVPSPAFPEVVQLLDVQSECGYLRLPHWSSGKLGRPRVKAGQFPTSSTLVGARTIY